MAAAKLEERVAQLEEKVARLLEKQGATKKAPWWEIHVGAFQNNPLYDEAMRLGAEYRTSQPNAADSPNAIEP